MAGKPEAAPPQELRQAPARMARGAARARAAAARRFAAGGRDWAHPAAAPADGSGRSAAGEAECGDAKRRSEAAPAKSWDLRRKSRARPEQSGALVQITRYNAPAQAITTPRVEVHTRKGRGTHPDGSRTRRRG